MPTVIKIPALRVQQSPGKVLFQFSIDGKQLERFATISRIRRNDEREIKGYQRPEALSHIASIRKYIESKSPMIPNAIVIAFTEEVKFVPTPGQSSDNIVRHGDLHIPALKDGEEGEVIGWIVDGQQRTAAIRAANVKSFPIPVTAFVAKQESEQREQFILVNSVSGLLGNFASTRQLPAEIGVLLLVVLAGGLLGSWLGARRLPAQGIKRLLAVVLVIAGLKLLLT